MTFFKEMGATLFKNKMEPKVIEKRIKSFESGNIFQVTGTFKN